MRSSYASVSAAVCVVIIGMTGCRDEVPVYGEDPFSRDPPPIGSLAGKILTTNVGDDTLSVLDPQQPGPARRLPVGLNRWSSRGRTTSQPIPPASTCM